MTTLEIEPVMIPIKGTSVAPLTYTANSSGVHREDTITLPSSTVVAPAIEASPRGTEKVINSHVAFSPGSHEPAGA